MTSAHPRLGRPQKRRESDLDSRLVAALTCDDLVRLTDSNDDRLDDPFSAIEAINSERSPIDWRGCSGFGSI